MVTSRSSKWLPRETLAVLHRRDQLRAHVHTALKISEAPLSILVKAAITARHRHMCRTPFPRMILGTPQQSTNC